MNTIELFAGAGGLGIGVSLAGFHPVQVVERDQYCCDTLKENRERGIAPVRDWPVTKADVRTIDFRPHEGQVELVTGGPPCQPFSIGGKHRAYDDARDMFPQAVRVLREVKPRAFIFENVKGLTRQTFRSYFEYIKLQMTYPEVVVRPEERWLEHLRRLERHATGRRHEGLHYHVVSEVLNAADYGIPQRRERVFFVGFRSDLDVRWCFPNETHSQDALAWAMWGDGSYWDEHRVAKRHRPKKPHATVREAPRTSARWRTVRDALVGLPDPELNKSASAAVLNHRFQPGARSYAGHTGSALDAPAKTLKAGVHGVPGGENMLLRPDGSVRYFTVRESARLQTFPDDFIFHGSWSETMRQLGNAVPVRLAETVALHVADHLGSLHGEAVEKRRSGRSDRLQPA